MGVGHDPTWCVLATRAEGQAGVCAATSVRAIR